MANVVSHLREFGKFQLDPHKLVLWCDGQPVGLPLKEIELLCVLTEAPGEVVTKNEIIDRLWADSFVEDGNLSRHIYLIRKILKKYGEKEDLIQTVPRRGYRFAGNVRTPGNGDFVIERHSLTRTLVEEIDDGQRVSSDIVTSSGKWIGYLIASVTALVLILGVGWLWRADSAGSSPVAASRATALAIFPLRPLDRGADDGSLGPGITESLISRLGALRSIVIRSTDSAARLIEAQEDPISIGKMLNAEAVLTGSYQRSDGRIRVAVRLLRVADGTQIWAENFDETETEIFRMQDLLSAHVAASLVRSISPEERQLLSKRYTENRDAYHAYLRGRYYFNKRSPENYRKAIEEFEQAAALDPNYALALTGIADVYSLQANTASGDESNALYEKAKQIAVRALDLDDGLAEAHTSLGWIKRVHDWDWEGSEREFKRALEINPNYVNARQWYGFLLTTLGRKNEGLAEMEKARELDPLSQIVLQNYFAVVNFSGDRNSLPKVARDFAMLDVDEGLRVRIQSTALSALGDHASVIRIGEAFLSNKNLSEIPKYLIVNMAIAYAKLGNAKRSEEMIDHLKRLATTNSESVYRLAQVYAELGRPDEAIDMLEKCFEDRDDRMVWLKVEPHFDRLRNDSRFQTLMSKMRLA
jgi:DNA-binding winged helix-turn-helix (wHTH) protein/TolB-like protein/Tfp pilus assembly protein PilF